MKVALFVPCYVDQFYPKVGIATLELLEKMGCEVDYPMDQTCCGQPIANSGGESVTGPITEHFVQTFQQYEYIVCPSGSCAYHVKHHYTQIKQTTQVKRVRANTYELAEFLIDVLKIDSFDLEYNGKVSLHESCHGLRGLRIGTSSERMDGSFSKIRYLLSLVKGMEILELDRKDECCGFGGTYSVTEPEVSVKMGMDRMADHLRNNSHLVLSADMSCLMHLEGLAKRQKTKLRFAHIAELLNGNLS